MWNKLPEEVVNWILEELQMLGSWANTVLEYLRGSVNIARGNEWAMFW